MGSEVLDRQQLLTDYEAYEALAAKIASASHDVLTLSDLQWIATRRERVARAQGAVDHKIVTRIAEQLTPQATGGNSMRDILVHSLRISRAEAERRFADAEEFGPRRTLNGEPLPPKLPPRLAARSAQSTFG
nr:DUF222 domain-containing protein [Mycolicibacterium septicum]